MPVFYGVLHGLVIAHFPCLPASAPETFMFTSESLSNYMLNRWIQERRATPQTFKDNVIL